MEELLNMEVGKGMDWKFSIITRFIERVEPDAYLIHDTSNGWYIATVNRMTLERLLKGEKDLMDLHWD